MKKTKLRTFAALAATVQQAVATLAAKTIVAGTLLARTEMLSAMAALLAGTTMLAAGCENPGVEPNPNNGQGNGNQTGEIVAVTGVTLNVSEITLIIGDTEALIATVAPENATDKSITWVSGRERVATVDQNGVVHAIAKGTAVISAVTNNSRRVDVCTVTVNEYVNRVTSITLDHTELTLDLGETAQLEATVLPTDATHPYPHWDSNDYSVCSVDSYGNLTASTNTVGIATITASATDGSGIVASCIVTVRQADAFGTVGFVTPKTWTVGNQIWSDAVTGSVCDKNTYDGGVGGAYKIDCMRHPVDASWGDMFSFYAVVLNGGELCPDEWRVPTIADFEALDMALNGKNTGRNNDPASVANFADPEKWAAKYTGEMLTGTNPASPGQGFTQFHGQTAQYWTNEENFTTGGGYHLRISNQTNSVDPNFGSHKYKGMALRCVKDKN